MRAVQPITRTFRRQLQAFGAAPLPRNWLLRRVLWLLRQVNCLLHCEGARLDQTATVTTTLALLRLPDTFAKATYISNQGSQAVTVLEEGIIIALIAPGVRQRLPVSGRLTLRAKTDASTSSIRIQTYERCLCGEDAPPYDTGVITPSGVNLL